MQQLLWTIGLDRAVSRLVQTEILPLRLVCFD